MTSYNGNTSYLSWRLWSWGLPFLSEPVHLFKSSNWFSSDDEFGDPKSLDLLPLLRHSGLLTARR